MDKDKELQPQPQPAPRPAPRYSLEQLETFVTLHIILTGKKPESLELTEGYYNWYVQEVQATADALGLNIGWRGGNPTFTGIKLEKKVKIEVPETNGIIK